jgi:hypothetical protein
MEVWKDVVGLEGYYQVSNIGRIKSVPRKVIRGRGGVYQIEEKLINPSINSDGYLTGSFSVNKKKYFYKAHSLVAKAFIGERLNGYEVNHKNGIKTDNRLENLEIITKSENIKHAFRLGLNIPNRGEKNGNSKYTKEQAIAVKRMTKEGKTEGQIKKDLNCSFDFIRDIRKGRTWKHV